MLIESWPVDRPKPYPKNARKWSKSAVETVATSIREYGFRQPIVVDANDVIIIGHLRLQSTSGSLKFPCTLRRNCPRHRSEVCGSWTIARMRNPPGIWIC